jgi:hypothetical protein
MGKHASWLTSTLLASWALATVLVAQGPPPSQFPTEITAIRHNSGQPVIPYFEGWIPNRDGTFDMVFGYFNRNYVQEFAIPAGPDNKVEPGSVDQGQPTYFLARRQRYVYRVRVPKDFGKQEVVWTITSNGRAEKAFGNLMPPQEITERVVMTNGNFDPGLDDPNKPPTVKVGSPQNAATGNPVTLTATVSDDGLPKPRVVAPAPAPRPAAPTPGGFGAQVNSSGGNRGPRPLSVTWMQYGGPAKVSFERGDAIVVENGQAVTKATFPAPGKYRLVAIATDPGRLSTQVTLDVTVTGTARPTSGQQ